MKFTYATYKPDFEGGVRVRFNTLKEAENNNEGVIVMEVSDRHIGSELITHENLISSPIVWIPEHIKPMYDGYYVCFIEKLEVCGNVTKHKKVLQLHHQKFIVDDSEKVTHWINLPNP